MVEWKEVEAELQPGGGSGCHGAASGPDSTVDFPTVDDAHVTP